MKTKANRLWQEFRTDEVCGLCGNQGIIDTRGHIKTPRGDATGIRAWCICPNGRAMKKAYGWEGLDGK